MNAIANQKLSRRKTMTLRLAAPILVGILTVTSAGPALAYKPGPNTSAQERRARATANLLSEALDLPLRGFRFVGPRRGAPQGFQAKFDGLRVSYLLFGTSEKAKAAARALLDKRRKELRIVEVRGRTLIDLVGRRLSNPGVVRRVLEILRGATLSKPDMAGVSSGQAIEWLTPKPAVGGETTEDEAPTPEAPADEEAAPPAHPHHEHTPDAQDEETDGLPLWTRPSPPSPQEPAPEPDVPAEGREQAPSLESAPDLVSEISAGVGDPGRFLRAQLRELLSQVFEVISALLSVPESETPEGVESTESRQGLIDHLEDAESTGPTKQVVSEEAPSAESPIDTSNLGGLQPEFRQRVEAVLRRLQAAGWEPRVASGLRTQAEQDELVELGYSTVRNSMHLHGLAADVIDRRYGWAGLAADQQFQFWLDLGAAAQAEGLTWGGNWSTPDVAHIQAPR